MTVLNLQSPTTWIVAVASLALVGGGVWAFTRGEAQAGVAVPKELSVDALKAQAKDDPGKMRDAMRDTMQRDDLTEEQRRQIGENMRKVWQDFMQQRVEEYYAAKTEEDRNAILDKQIDEFEQRRKEWEDRRKEEEKKTGKKEDPNASRPGAFGPQSREERKERAESRNPDQMARQMAYLSAMRQRMAQRGMTPPSFGPGGRGGPGGGRGPRNGP